MAIYLSHNPYLGLNAHHLSLFQNVPGDWEIFHTDHITHIKEALQAQLPPEFIARSERSIQILAQEGELPPHKPIRTRPDVLILETSPAESIAPAGVSAPTLSLALEETLLTFEAHPEAVVIYQVGQGGLIGKPVTRIELLSESNKIPQAAYQKYLLKRDETLHSGIGLVELDYLHQTPFFLSAFEGLALPVYPAQGAYPYSIVVSIPYPSVEMGSSDLFGFSVGDSVPIVPIPLGPVGAIPFDFGRVYDRFIETDGYSQRAVNYEQLPARLETYSPDDQARIQAIMAQIATAG